MNRLKYLQVIEGIVLLKRNVSLSISFPRGEDDIYLRRTNLVCLLLERNS